MNSIQVYRKQAGLTQAELAAAAGLGSQSVIANYESGLRRPSVENLSSIRDALCGAGVTVTLDDLALPPGQPESAA